MNDIRLPLHARIGVLLLGVIQAAMWVGFALAAVTLADQIQPVPLTSQPTPISTTAMVAAATLGTLALGIALMRHIIFTWSERVGYRLVQQLRLGMYAHLQGMLPQELRHRARGGLLLRLTGDLSMLRLWWSRGVLAGSAAALQLLAGVAVMAWIDVPVTLAVIAVVALLGAISVALGRPMRRATRRMRRRRSLLFSAIDEHINAMATVQTAGRVRGELARLSRRNDSMTESLLRMATLRGGLRGLATAATGLTTTVVLVTALLQVRQHQLELAGVVGLLVMVPVISRATLDVGLAHDYWHRGQVSRQKVEEYFASSSTGWDTDAPRTSFRSGHLELDEVRIDGRLSLDRTVASGTWVAVVDDGGPAAGALLEMLASLRDPDSGTITLDGTPLPEASRLDRSRAVGYQGPLAPLLRGTLRRNLAYRRRHARPAELGRVITALGLGDVVATTPGGLMGWVTEGGSNLPRGERQLWEVARALVGAPPLLLLDHPTDGLDDASRGHVLETVARHAGTVIMVTTRADECELADEVWHLTPDGVQVGSGLELARERWMSEEMPWAASTTTVGATAY